MPNPSERVNLAECSTQGRPPGFTNASPIAKRVRGSVDRMWKLILTVLVILAVAGVAYFVWVVFVTPPAAPSS